MEEGEDSEEEEFEGPGDSECEEEEDPRSIFDKLFDVPIKTKKKSKFVEKPWEAKDLIEKVANTEDHPSQGTIFYPCFVYLMRVYLIVVISTAECERIFSRLKLVKTTLRNKLDYSLERILQVAQNGPSLKEAMSKGGIVDQALMYFFGRQNRNLKVPNKYKAQKDIVEKLDKIKWGIKVPHPEIPMP